MSYILIDNLQLFFDVVKEFENEKIIGIDTEFVRESSFYPKLSLIQISSSNKVWVIDVLKIKVENIKKLASLLCNKRILKVMHASRLDQECLYYNVGFIARPVLDTSIGAALLGYGESLGLDKITYLCLRKKIQKGKARTNWFIRPIPKTLLEYAINDAKYLVPLGKKLIKELKKVNRLKWALDESIIDSKLYEINQEELFEQAIKTQLEPSERGIFYELLIWREKKAREKNLPKNWIISTDTLHSLSKAKPGSLKELLFFRGINKNLLKESGNEIIKIINSALPIEWEKNPVIDECLLTLVNLYVKIIAKKNSISSKFLLSKEKIKKILSFPSIEKKELNKILGKNAAKIILRPLMALLSGKTALTIRKNKLCEIKI